MPVCLRTHVYSCASFMVYTLICRTSALSSMRVFVPVSVSVCTNAVSISGANSKTTAIRTDNRWLIGVNELV